MSIPAAIAVAVALGAAIVGLCRSWLRARDVPLSPIRGDSYIGADWIERRGLGTGETPVGEMDDMAAYAREEFNSDQVHPEVRRFYEHTAEYKMVADVTWHPGFRLGAALAAPLTSRIEQLNLPGPDGTLGRLEGRFVGVDIPGDPREEVRAWIRTNNPADGSSEETTEEAVFVALYGSHVTDGIRYVNIAVPLPASNLSTVLRLDHLGNPVEESTGVELTTRAPGDPGLYFVTPIAPFELPMEQRFRVWPATHSDAPESKITTGTEDTSAGDPDLMATHEMWFGVKFLTVTYAIRRRADR